MAENTTKIVMEQKKKNTMAMQCH